MGESSGVDGRGPAGRQLSTFELVARARQGDRRAFDRLVEKYRRRVEALIHLRLGRRLRQFLEPSDIEQEAYLRVVKSLPSFEWNGSGSYYRWLGGIVEHVIKSKARHHLGTAKRKRGCEVSIERAASNGRPPALIGSFTSPSNCVRRQERLERLEKALDSLSEDHREVILLRRIRELPFEDVAERMDRSVDAVSMLLLRALRKLREAFGETGSVHLPRRAPYPSRANRGGAHVSTGAEMGPPAAAGRECPSRTGREERSLEAPPPRSSAPGT